MNRYFWLLSDRKTVRELSREKWRQIHQQNLRYANKKCLSRIDDNDVYLSNGRCGFWVSLRQLMQVLGKEV